jgi:hypothetical protein
VPLIQLCSKDVWRLDFMWCPKEVWDLFPEVHPGSIVLDRGRGRVVYFHGEDGKTAMEAVMAKWNAFWTLRWRDECES